MHIPFIYKYKYIYAIPYVSYGMVYIRQSKNANGQTNKTVTKTTDQNLYMNVREWVKSQNWQSITFRHFRCFDEYIILDTFTHTVVRKFIPSPPSHPKNRRQRMNTCYSPWLRCNCIEWNDIVMKFNTIKKTTFQCYVRYVWIKSTAINISASSASSYW